MDGMAMDGMAMDGMAMDGMASVESNQSAAMPSRQDGMDGMEDMDGPTTCDFFFFLALPRFFLLGRDLRRL
jgi:hypothetical protein